MAPTTQTLYAHATIITVNKTRDVILDGALLIHEDRIQAIRRTAELTPQLTDCVKVIDCRNRIIIPGLINTHAHLSQSLMRGLAEDLPLFNWLCDSIWPLEAVVQGLDGYGSARLTIAEMLKSGTTCFWRQWCLTTAGWTISFAPLEKWESGGCIVCSTLAYG
jgi:cytosine/adenosine deaminase-related metal-dependent hydrolase